MINQPEGSVDHRKLLLRCGVHRQTRDLWTFFCTVLVRSQKAVDGDGPGM